MTSTEEELGVDVGHDDQTTIKLVCSLFFAFFFILLTDLAAHSTSHFLKVQMHFRYGFIEWSFQITDVFM